MTENCRFITKYWQTGFLPASGFERSPLLIEVEKILQPLIYCLWKEMFLMSENVLTFTKENFEKEVLQSDKPVLVDFWAAWCGPCRMIAPVIDQIANEFAGRVKVGKVNVDDESELAQKYRIMSIPTLMVFKDGKLAESVLGARSKEDLSKMLENHL